MQDNELVNEFACIATKVDVAELAISVVGWVVLVAIIQTVVICWFVYFLLRH